MLHDQRQRYLAELGLDEAGLSLPRDAGGHELLCRHILQPSPSFAKLHGQLQESEAQDSRRRGRNAPIDTHCLHRCDVTAKPTEDNQTLRQQKGIKAALEEAKDMERTERREKSRVSPQSQEPLPSMVPVMDT